MCDEFTRENLARRIGRSITAAAVVDALDEAYAQRGAPEFIRCDNGPELVAMAILDWCRFMGTGTAYIEPGSPWENPCVESFNGRLRDELFAREVFDTVMEARILFDDWGDVYNRHRPPQRARLPGARRLRRRLELAKGGLRPATISDRDHHRWQHQQPGTLIEGGPANRGPVRPE